MPYAAAEESETRPVRILITFLSGIFGSVLIASSKAELNLEISMGNSATLRLFTAPASLLKV